jgi:hypothetical protein
MITIDHVTSAAILGLSFAGRWYAPKIGITRMPFTISILCNTYLLLTQLQWCQYFTIYLFSKKKRGSLILLDLEKHLKRILNSTLLLEEHGIEL